MIMTIDEMKNALEHAAYLKGELDLERAKHEDMINQIKSQYEAAISEREGEFGRLRTELIDFAERCPETFQRPRTIKTEFGEVGLTSSQKLIVDDAARVKQFADRHGYGDLYSEAIKTNVTAIKKHLRSGESVPGVHLECADIPRVDIAAALRDAAATR